MSKIPGVGYNPGPGTVYWVRPGGGQVATSTFNPNAPDPFASSQVNIQAFRDRYGCQTDDGRFHLPDGTACMFPVDAESIGILMRAMAVMAEKGGHGEFTGTSSTHDMNPTNREAYDYAATHSDGGRSLISQAGFGGGGGSATGGMPGRPRITSITSLSPGQVTVSWITGPAEKFEIDFLSPSFHHSIIVNDPKKGNIRTVSLDLPVQLFGKVEIKVRGSLGGAFGQWSIAKSINVVESGSKDSIPSSGPPATSPSPSPSPDSLLEITESDLTELKLAAEGGKLPDMRMISRVLYALASRLR